MYLLIVILPLIGSSVAGFFGRFLGSEGSTIMTAGGNLVLCGIVLVFSSILLGLFRVSLTKLYGKGFVLVIRTCLFFLIALYLGFLRVYTMSLWSLLLFGLVVSNEGGVIFNMVSGNGASSGANSGWTSILGSGSSGGNSGWTSILGQGDGSASSVNQPTPTDYTRTGSSEMREDVINSIPDELQRKKTELHNFVFSQFMHYMSRGLKSWQMHTDPEQIELSNVCVRDIIDSLEIGDSVSEYERWKSHLRTNPTTLHPLFQDYKTKRI